MDLQRTFLIAGIFLVSFLLLIEWNKFDDARKPTASVSETTESIPASIKQKTATVSTGSTDNDIPSATPTAQGTDNFQQTNNSSLISIETDVFSIKIDKNGGDIVKVALKKHWAEIDSPDVPFELLNRTQDHLYIAQSGLIGKNGTDSSGSRPLFNSAKSSYVLTEDQQQLTVDLVYQQSSNITITKRFIFKSNTYLVDLQYLINNQSDNNWQAQFFGQIKRDNFIPPTSAIGMQPFLGVATTTSDERYKKMDFDDLEEESFKNSIDGGWVALVQHYFISAWIGNADENNHYSAKKLKNSNIYILGYTTDTKTISAGTQGEINARFYAGPKNVGKLEQISPYLDLTVDYGWLWWVAKPIHSVLEIIFSFVKNWGWSIVLLTLLIKVALFPLSHKAYISMAAMRKVTPKMTAIREQYGDNRQKLQEEMLKLYRTEKINPMGGCFPMLLQMPVFLALYWVLMESVELRHAPFIGWIEDLSVMDPYFCLPILMGASMFFQQKMNPPPPDPTQAKVMQFLPVIFTFMFLWFPAGLVLYWLVNNVISMLHQGIINKRSEA